MLTRPLILCKFFLFSALAADEKLLFAEVIVKQGGQEIGTRIGLVFQLLEKAQLLSLQKLHEVPAIGRPRFFVEIAFPMLYGIAQEVQDGTDVITVGCLLQVCAGFYAFLHAPIDAFIDAEIAVPRSKRILPGQAIRMLEIVIEHIIYKSHLMGVKKGHRDEELVFQEGNGVVKMRIANDVTRKDLIEDTVDRAAPLCKTGQGLV